MHTMTHPPVRRKMLVVGLAAALASAGATAMARVSQPTASSTLATVRTANAMALRASSIDASGDLAMPGSAATSPSTASNALTATHVVTNCNDSGPGSLRDAVINAASGDTVDMSELGCGFIDLQSALVVNQNDLSIIGSTVTNTTTIEPADISSAFGLVEHNGSGTLYLYSLTLTSGTVYSTVDSKYLRGGCLDSSGNVILVDSTVKYCDAVSTGVDGEAKGGGIFAEGDVELYVSSVHDNFVVAGAEAHGGGIFAGGALTLTASTIDGNGATSNTGLARFGGAAGHAGGTITYSTISNNYADTNGGVWLGGGSAFISSSTISGNESHGSNANAAGIYITTPASGTVDIRNSTITANVAHAQTSNTAAGLFISTNGQVDMVSTIVSGNWYWTGVVNVPSDMISVSNGMTGHDNLVGFTIAGSDPIPADTIRQYETPLGPLQDNGGPTRTHMPLKGSWAFNLGHDGSALARGDGPTDQRGYNRLVGAGVDIGAVESDSLFVGRFEQPERGGG